MVGERYSRQRELHLERPGGDIVHLAPLGWMKFLKCSQNHLG